jgi:hypothetical protein
MNNFDITSFNPTVVTNFLPQEYINKLTKDFEDKVQDNIKNNRDKYYDFNKNEKMGMVLLEIAPITNGDIFEHIYKKTEEVLGTKIEINSSLKYHRYTAESGNDMPAVGPHVDQIHEQHFLAFSLPINNTSKKIWPIYIDKTRYNLEDNTAIFFNATNTLHWRPIRRFTGEDFYDVLVFRFFERDNPVKIPTDLKDSLEKQRIHIMNNYYH